ncbi:MAG: acyl-ACP--UDP-N- acetylglucosamine O-acyltransferase [Dermatophilaceae bacterium]
MTSAATRVHATAVVGPGVDLGAGVVVGPHAVLMGPLEVGDEVWVGPGVHLGGPPEIGTLRHNVPWEGDLDYHPVRIGARTRLRDAVTIHHGSVRETLVGADCLLFAGSYVAHDVHIGDGVTLSAGTSVGGHATIRSGANLGLNVSVHQRRVIGPLAMIGMGTTVTRDVPPYATAYGVPPRVHGVNGFGMRRAGFADEVADLLLKMYAGTGDPAALPDAVRAELAWWDAVPGRRPMAWATSHRGEP